MVLKCATPSLTVGLLPPFTHNLLEAFIVYIM